MTIEVPKLAYSVKEAVHASSLKKSTIYNYIAAGKLETRRVGGRTIIPAASLMKLLQGEAA
ncbi:putative DNA-binding transcriptional regulator AlpA [Novosphingobium hassiacum]|uniref:Putative DNA-binding transcriptional regulator AlpA n=1 Tax=Novosphingobium hassiacum TaxID=173676 RepID=A0A7W6A1B1_9SPHN|nr:helix-turn-helix domain-containing protein [Novosphingobium hassiacum]MBB3862222.1 putative DNA-binding transcriptional regulator AlpA [Novosphingobium hassiacum]